MTIPKISYRCGLFIALLSGLIYALYPDNYPAYPQSKHYSMQSQTFVNSSTDRPLDQAAAMSAMWQLLSSPEKFSPRHALPMQTPDWSAFFAQSEQAKFIWFGHSTLMARIGGTTLMIDPVFAEYASPTPIMMKRFQPAPVDYRALPPVDLILYSHNHYDHLDETVVRHFATKPTRFIVPLGMSVLLKKWGVKAENIQEMDWWQALKLGNFTLHAVPAKHNTVRGLFDRNKTFWCGYVFETASEKIYFSGDSAFGDGAHFEAIGHYFGGFDLAFVENGQYNLAWIDNHMLPPQTAEAARLLKTERMMPIHWAAYPLAIHPWAEPVQQSLPLVERYGIQPLTPKMGQVFDKASHSEKWWQGLE